MIYANRTIKVHKSKLKFTLCTNIIAKNKYQLNLKMKIAMILMITKQSMISKLNDKNV